LYYILTIAAQIIKFGGNFKFIFIIITVINSLAKIISIKITYFFFKSSI